MKLQLQDVFECVGDKFPIKVSLDFSSGALEQQGNSLPVTAKEPLVITGLVENKAGVVLLCYDATLLATFDCDRCLKPTDMSFTGQFSHILIRAQDPPVADALLVEQGKLDLFSVAFADILLLLPSKLLCDEQCEGLCASCGCNRNEIGCDCDDKTEQIIDPRLAVLGQLLNEE